jgi:hypothetical protein
MWAFRLMRYNFGMPRVNPSSKGFIFDHENTLRFAEKHSMLMSMCNAARPTLAFANFHDFQFSDD